MDYPYITENNLLCRQYYHYARYDESVFQAYAESRSAGKAPADVEERLRAYCQTALDGFVMRKELEQIILNCLAGEVRETWSAAEKIVKTFEVRKRLYHCYNEKMKPYDERDFEDTSLYVLLSCAMLLCYERSGNLKYLNALLKADDTLLSLSGKREDGENMGDFLAYCLDGEKRCIGELMEGAER